MPVTDKSKPRSTSYIFEEGNSGGGPDSGSSVSSSSTGSSMKFIAAKLKPQGRTRLLVLVLIVVIVVIVVAAVSTAVYFTNGKQKGDSKWLQHSDKESGGGEYPGVSSPASTTSTGSSVDTRSPTTAVLNSTVGPNITSTSTSFPVTTSEGDTSLTSTLPETTTPYVDNTEPSEPAVSISDVFYHPEDVKSLTLKCQGRHSGNWNTLTLRRQFHDSYEPIAAAARNEDGTAGVIVFYPNVTNSLVVRNYELTLILTIDPFYCQQLTNFTCALDTDEVLVSTGANVSVFMPGIQMKLPHSVVEDLLITLQCTVDVFDTNATIIWKFRPSGSDRFMDFSVAPVTEVTQRTPCTYYINSTLTFTPTMYENGSDFRCELSAPWWSPSIVQEKSTTAVLQVLPKSFCDDKRQFSIHPHPNGPCTRVIYCLNTGPLVYEIECEQGYCYDTTKTSCILQDET